jgi:putative transposase
MPHRKRLQHFNEPGHLHFMTFSCYRRLPLLTNELFRTWLSRALDAALVTHDFQLSGFVFMPEHVHLLVWPQRPTYSIASFQHSFKRPFSLRVKTHLAQSGNPLLNTLTIRDRPHKTAFCRM